MGSSADRKVGGRAEALAPLFQAELYDSFDQIVWDRLIEREAKISLFARPGRERLHEPRIAGYRRVEANVIFEGGEVYQDSALPERGNSIAQ
jgi:hypothetical protein